MKAPTLPLGIGQWTCIRCGAVGWMSNEAERVLRQSSATFYCLFGHAQHFPLGKSRADLLEEQIAAERRARQRAEQKIAEYADAAHRAGAEVREAEAEARHQRARANGYKGHAAKLTHRAKGGACPCCNRFFVKLHKHMTSKHPGFALPPELENPPRGQAKETLQ